jgi:hypothetical protein
MYGVSGTMRETSRGDGRLSDAELQHLQGVLRFLRGEDQPLRLGVESRSSPLVESISEVEGITPVLLQAEDEFDFGLIPVGEAAGEERVLLRQVLDARNRANLGLLVVRGSANAGADRRYIEVAAKIREELEAKGDAVFELRPGQLPIWFAIAMRATRAGGDGTVVALAARLAAYESELSGVSEDEDAQLLVALSCDQPAVGEPGAGIDQATLSTLAMSAPLAAELKRMHHVNEERERSFAAVQAGLEARKAQARDLAGRLAAVSVELQAERDRRSEVEDEMAKVVDTRAWRVIAVQHRFRKAVVRRLRAFIGLFRRRGEV